MATEQTSSSDLFTVIAIAILAYVGANITHEIIGHCGPFWALNVVSFPPRKFASMALLYGARSREIEAGVAFHPEVIRAGGDEAFEKA